MDSWKINCLHGVLKRNRRSSSTPEWAMMSSPNVWIYKLDYWKCEWSGYVSLYKHSSGVYILPFVGLKSMKNMTSDQNLEMIAIFCSFLSLKKFRKNFHLGKEIFLCCQNIYPWNSSKLKAWIKNWHKHLVCEQKEIKNFLSHNKSIFEERGWLKSFF